MRILCFRPEDAETPGREEPEVRTYWWHQHKLVGVKSEQTLKETLRVNFSNQKMHPTVVLSFFSYSGMFNSMIILIRHRMKALRVYEWMLLTSFGRSDLFKY